MFFIRICLTLMILLNTVIANANDLKCSDIFLANSPNGLEVLKLVRPGISEDIRTSNWVRNFFFRKALKFVSLDYLQSHPNAQLEETSKQILKNLRLVDFFQFPPFSRENYIAGSQTNIPKNFIDRNILEYGLTKLIHEAAQSNPTFLAQRYNNPNFWTKLREKIQVLTENKAFLFLVDPVSLIRNKDSIQLPSDLIAKIVLDGAPSHMSEIELWFQKQIPINKWNHAITALKSIVYIISAIISYEMYEDFQKTLQENQKEELFKNLDSMDENLNNLDDYFKNAGFYK